MSKITSVAELRRELAHQGYTTRMGGKGHWKVYRGHRFVTTLPATPSDIRSIRNCVSDLKRSGFERPDHPAKGRRK